MDEPVVLSSTRSVCPECLATLPAFRVKCGDRIFLKKECPEHGPFEVLIWSGDPSYESWSRRIIPTFPLASFAETGKGCPWDCGLCTEHRQPTCCTLLEVTGRCDLRCSFCFADAGRTVEPDPDIATIKTWYERLLEAGGPYVVQLSGGEPTLRDDLPEIITLGRSLGFDFIQLNTNGLRLADDPSYVERLKEAGLGCVFLQFDGMTDGVYQEIRGRPLLNHKLLAIERCASHGIGVVLVPTLVRGINMHQAGRIIDFAIEHVPAVRGVHFQPVSYFGRYPGGPPQEERITIPEVIREIELQTRGAIKAENIKPSGGQNSYCSFNGNFVLMPDGELKPWTFNDPNASCCKQQRADEGAKKSQRFVARYWSAPEKSNCCTGKGPSLGGWDIFIERASTHSLCISGMAFQDAWNLDLDRLKECCVHVLHPDGRIIPFCAYNLTDSKGRSFYRADCHPNMPQG
jgi:7,8-dihydro-6-hydroxymethylpterin dimethyltransferase